MFSPESSSFQRWWDITFTCFCSTALYPHQFVLSLQLSQNRSPSSQCNLSELLTLCSREIRGSLDYLGLVFKTRWIWLEFFSTFSHPSYAIYDFDSYREKPNKMQQCIKILLFLVLNEAPHVLGDTPPIIRSLKLHKQPLVLHTWKFVRMYRCCTLSGCCRSYAT